MKRFWGRALAGAAVVALSAALVPACAHNDTTLFVYDVLAPQLVATGTSCSYTSSVSQPFITEGKVDFYLATGELTNGYFAEFLVGNQLVSQANPNEGKTETSFIEVQGAAVTIKDQSGTQVLSQYTYNASTTIPPASGGTPVFSPIGILLVDEPTLKAYGLANDRFLTFTRFFGVTLGGQSVTSNEYEFPVDICAGCLITFSPSDINSAARTPNCIGNGQAPPTTVPCIPGQDLPIDCTFCKASVCACDPNNASLESPCNGGAPPSSQDSGAPASPPTMDAGSDSGDAADSSDAGSDTGLSDAPSGDSTTSDAELDAQSD